jgi:hypothetical protein
MINAPRKLLSAAWALGVLPWFWLALRELVGELRAPGEMSDAPYTFAALALIDIFVPWSGACLLLAAIVSVYVCTKDPPMPSRVAAWFSLLLGGVASLSLGLGPVMPRSRSMFDAIEALWIGALLALAIAWGVHAPRRAHGADPHARAAERE